MGDRTLFQQALDRVGNGARFAPPVVVAGAGHVPLIEAQAVQSAGLRVIVEPAARNTAPAIASAAHALPEDAIMLVCPSDHHISDLDAFLGGVDDAATLAAEGRLVAFGIAPTAPETGYGYIRTGESLGSGHVIDRFIEKPDLASAERFIADTGYVWNSGMFVFRAGLFLEELARQRPVMARLVAESWRSRREDGWQIHPEPTAFATIVAESIDYAVMENAEGAAVVGADIGWSDIGNWDALMAARPADSHGNHISGRADLLDCHNVMVEAASMRVSVVGLEDVIVVVDGNEVLVTSRSGSQAVGKLPGALGR